MFALLCHGRLSQYCCIVCPRFFVFVFVTKIALVRTTGKESFDSTSVAQNFDMTVVASQCEVAIFIRPNAFRISNASAREPLRLRACYSRLLSIYHKFITVSDGNP